MLLEKEFNGMKKVYSEIFENFYPSKNGTGFVEKNISVNFAKSYETIHNSVGEKCFSWFELQFGNRNNKHIDCCIVNITTKELFLIESKRFNNVESKRIEVYNDIERLINFEIVSELSSRLENISDYTVYGVILADVWCENEKKTNVYSDFFNSVFEIKASVIPKSIEYYSCGFDDIQSNIEKWTQKNKNNYKLLGLSWKIR